MYLTKFIDKKIILVNYVKEKANICGITDYSKNIRPGMLFIIVKGNNKDGLEYLKEVLDKGAHAVLMEIENIPKTINLKNINVLRTKNIRLASSRLAKVFYPKQPKNIVAITGTNGKTSVAHYLHCIWKKNNYKSATIGTLGIKYNNIIKKTKLTTPGPISLHKEIHLLKEKNIQYVALEASSHAIHQHRIDSLDIKIAIFTNLTRDHMDYHLSMKNYFSCKQRLFLEILSKSGLAVINIDNKYGELLKEICKKKNINYISYGFSKSDWRIIEVIKRDDYSEVKIEYKKRVFKFSCKLFANYQIENLIAAIIVANIQKISLGEILKIVEKIKNPIGRLDKVKDITKSNLSIFIDYAHSPHSLEKSLKAIIKMRKKGGKVILVFGCGGDRDKGKRKFMAKVANLYADIIYITDDNPRTENPSKIRKQLSEFCKYSINIGDREKAIHNAILSMKEKDILLIAGKGHENYQEVMGEYLPFNDKIVAEEGLIRRVA